MTMTGSKLNSTDEQDFEMTTDIFHWLGNFVVYLINTPLVVLNLLANIFFGFCLMTRKTQQVKQPLTILLGSMVSCTILYVLSLTVLFFVYELVNSWYIRYISSIIVTLLMRVNMTSHVWLMFYYYTMIVPSQRALFLWVKKNIKSIIYVMMLFERLIFLGDASFEITFIMVYNRFNNGTVFVDVEMGYAFIFLANIYMFLCLLVMMISCFTMAHYLNKHMKSLAASNGSLSNPRLHSQIRVTVTGILQGVLCFLSTMWTLVDVIVLYYSPYFFDFLITITVINLYISGTTVNLGVGQTLFRERAVHVWKAVKKRLCGKSSKDLRPPGNLVTMTSISIIESAGVDTAMPLWL